MSVVLLRGDARELPLADASVDLIVTSPPYFGQRSYTDSGQHYARQIGGEETPAAYVRSLLDCTREWMRVLKPSGSLFVNLGDKYSSGAGAQTGEKSSALRSDKHGHGGGSKWAIVPPARPVEEMPSKCLLGLPWRYAIAVADQLGLILRAEIIWAKPNGLPESVTDRVRRAHEQVFHFTRQPRYYSAVDEVREPHQPQSIARSQRRYDAGDLFSVGTPNTLDPAQFCNPLGRLPGSVWDVPSQPLAVPVSIGVDHFAAWPMEIPRRIILGWSPPGVCCACGEGRRPLISKRVTGTQRTTENRSSMSRGSAALRGEGRKDLEVIPRQYEVTVAGYTCACPDAAASTTRAVVLDPFGGTGTTALVADALDRTGISVDRSADYCRLARWRTTDPGERAKAFQVPKPPPVPDGQQSLFGGAA